MPELKSKGVIPLNVANFDREELRVCLEHYRSAGVFSQRGPLDDTEFHRVRLLSGGNGKEVFKVVTGFI